MIALRFASFFLFDLLWFSAVAGRNEWLVVTLSLVFIQLALVVRDKAFNWKLYVQLLALGIVLESTAIAIGVIQFTDGLFPLWLLALWAGFVAMIISVFQYLKQHMIFAVMIGLVFGPLTYAVGVRIGAASLPYSEWLMWLVYAVLWGAYMAIFVRLLAGTTYYEKA